MKTLDELMQHLRESGIAISEERQRRELKNIGYYHGYKGYRFAGVASNRFHITDFSQIVALNDFDMEVKTLLYSKVMLIETALKNHVLEAVLADAQSTSFDQVYAKSMTAYQTHKGTKAYKSALLKRMRLKSEVDTLMMQRYRCSAPVIQHFLDEDRSVPLWALFEVMTLGTFGTFYSCLAQQVQNVVVAGLHMPSNFDSASILGNIIFALKDLRNAVAHNGVTVDVRFKNASVNHDIGKMLAADAGVNMIDFSEITDYVILIAYLLFKLQIPEDDIASFLNSYRNILNRYKPLLPQPIFSRLVHTNAFHKLSRTEQFIYTGTANADDISHV